MVQVFVRTPYQAKPGQFPVVINSESEPLLNGNQHADDKFRVVGTISVAFGCPFEGRVDLESVISDAEQFARPGISHVALGDTTGMASPQSVGFLCRLLASELPELTLIAHFHDSRGTGLVNCLAALEAGDSHFDCAFGGVGGHPTGVTYGGGYTGNVATEDLVNLFETEGLKTGIDLSALMSVSQQCEQALQRTLMSKVARTGINPTVL
ncbi:beta/alpha barrel domain-containing protein [Roseibium sp. M-1]